MSNGHYRIVRLLGRGGFGFVYEAQDTLLNEKVAIKELIPALVGDEEMLKRFLAEAKATMRLRHKRIVGTHNVFSEAGEAGDSRFYIIMEYMPGGSLEERLREHGPLPVDEAVRVAAEVCEGLACAHEEGVIHCDLKPHNILFDAQGQAKVADFGIAHVSGEMLTRSWHTPAGFVTGTLPYMSPEQTEGVRDDPRVDVYALGAVLYRMLTGQTYLDFDPRETPRSQSENVQRILEEQPLPPSTHSQEIPTWLDGVVLQALAKRPEARYADAGAMGAALQQGRPAPAATPPPLAPSPTPTPARATPPGPDARAVPSRKKRAPLPGWFWPVAGAAGVLLVVLVIIMSTILGGGDGGETAVPRLTERVVAVVTTAPALAPSRTPPSTAAPKGTDTPRPTATAMDTPRPTATRTPRPTDTALPPTATNTLQPTPTLAPTATPTPEAPQAGAAQRRNKDGMTMVYVPAGNFTMGSSNADLDALLAECSDCKRDWFINEQPQHTVYLDAFWIDRTEVSNAQYRTCVEAGSCQAPTSCDWGDPTYNDDAKADHPVVCVSWSGATGYCHWAGARLPTEAEWEKAARGTDRRRYPWGDSAADCSKAQFAECDGQTVRAGSKPAGASPYGALDMAGNVWEWASDWYDSGYYAHSPRSNPKGLDVGRQKVTRGASWSDLWENVRAAFRGNDSPGHATSHIGFRCAAGSPGE